jgi:hypothetical protein
MPPTTRPKAPILPDTDRLRNDPVYFTQQVLKRLDGQPAIPHPAQETLLRGIRRITVAACGRQFGKSEGLGYYGTWYAATKPNKRVYVIAPTLDQARIIFNEIARHFRTSLKSLVRGKVVEYPFPKIVLKNGTEIHARGANSPQYIRGKNAHLIICDEGAFFKDKTLTDVIQPMQTVTGKDPDAALILISTPFGEGAFKQFFEEARQADEIGASGFTALGDAWAYGISAGESWFQFPSSANPHADASFLARTKKRYGDDSLLWRTEYLAEFADDELQVIPWKHIKWAYENFPGYDEAKLPDFPLPPRMGHKYVQGCDLANRNDYFVAALLDTSDPDRVIFSEMTRYRGRGYTAIKASIREGYQRFHQAPTLVDATSLGESVVEDLNLLGVPAEGYKFTNQSKHEIVQELARLFAEHRLVIPYEQTILSELRYFEYDITPAGVVRMEAKRGHDDIVMALALAAHLALLPHEIGWFQAVEGLDSFSEHPVEVSNLRTTSVDVPYGVASTSLEALRSLPGTRSQLDRSPAGYRDPWRELDNDPDHPAVTTLEDIW